MNKNKLAVIFGGMSTENEVSLSSGSSILRNLNKEKYDILPIYIDKKGIWYKAIDSYEIENGEFDISKTDKIDNVLEYLKQVDIIFPVLHGLYGEDGTIQGLFELLNKPYVGCDVLASSVGMDKIYTKIIFDKANIKQTKSIYIKKAKNDYFYIDASFNEAKVSNDEIVKIVEDRLEYPIYVKPSNSGSSVGVSKVEDRKELIEAVINAGKYDRKILIEQGIIGKEVECAVLGNDDVIASCVGEIKAADEFYSYDAKYNNTESKTLIPAEIPENISKQIQDIAIKAFKAIDGKGLSRVDFFVEDKTQEIYLNEINTLPGFTNISMYPKLMEAIGISYSELLDKLIELAIENKN